VNPADKTPTPPVAIIGVGCLFPGAASLEAYWANIVNRVDAIGDIPSSHWRADDYFDVDPKSADMTYVRRGGFLSPVDFPLLDFGIAPNTLDAIDSTQLLGLLVASQALDDAGYGTGKAFDRNRTSVILGVTGTLPLVIALGARLGHPFWRQALKEAHVAEDVAERVVQRIADQYPAWQEGSFPGLLGNVVAGRIANRLDLGGTNCVVDAACASSLSALHLSLCELASGRTDIVLTGGMDCFNDIFMYVCFSKTLALSRTGNVRAFDVAGDGTILGEGLGCLVLKRLADAERDGDKVYAVIRGIGASGDGKGQAIYAPSPAGQVRALRQAYEVAGVAPETIELVEAHGTGTRAGDAAEVAALTSVYGAATESWCALGSVKSQIGHTKAAAGVAGLIKAALALHHQVLPPTINVTQPIELLLPGRSPFYVNTEARPWLDRSEHPRRAAVSSFGFGGSNFHCVLEEYRPEKREISWDGATQIIAFAAPSVSALQQAVASWPMARDSASSSSPSWDDIRTAAARSRAAFSVDAQCRLVVVLERGRTDPILPLARVGELLAQHATKLFWTTPDGIYFGSGKAAGGIGVLFPGQGSQYVGMLRDLACTFPTMLTALSEANDVFAESGPGQRLSDVIYPPSAFSVKDLAKNEAALRAVDVAQPALGAVNVGALHVLRHFGLHPDATAGHSYGELVALHAAGRMDAKSLHRLSHSRGRFMADRAGDPGSMLAVQASVAIAEQVLRDSAIELCIANKNAPKQTVLSGTMSEIERAAAAFARRDIPSRQLAVSAAFHSPLVAHVREQFATALQAVAFAPGEVPVFSNTTADVYPADPEQAKALLARQLAEPVAFSEQILRLYRWGARTFLEVGPGCKLTGLVGAILEGHEHAAIALDASSGKRAGVVDLARALSHLAALGHALKLDRWDPPGNTRSESKERTGPTVSICGANYVRPMMSPEPERPVERRHLMNPGEDNVVPQSAMKEEPVPEPRTASALATAQSQNAGDPGLLSAALRATQDNLLALQKLGEQTAKLHAQFLEHQHRTLDVFQSLMGQQKRMLQGTEAVRPVATPPDVIPRLAPVPLHGAPPAAQEVDARHEAEIEPSSLPAPVNRSAVAETLLAIVADKTGYPADVLRLDMELDADLGIDSIKRVEIFAAFQEKLPDTPAVTPQHIGSLRTLQSLVDFYAQGTQAAAKTSGAAVVGSAAPTVPVETLGADTMAPSPAAGNLKRYVLRQQPLPTNVARSTVAIARNAEIWVTADNTGLADRIVARLRVRGYQARLIALDDNDSLSPPGALAGLVLVAPRFPSEDELLRNAFRLLQRVGPALRETAKSGGALLCTVARLDGAFGLAGLSANANLLSGGLAGLIKTAALEWPELHCKALDLSEGVEADAGALSIVDEILFAGPAEVGIAAEGRCGLELAEQPLGTTTLVERAIEAGPLCRLRRSDLVVVSGGARGVTAEIAVALAESFGVSLLLLGRSREPQPEPDWLAPLTNENDIKKGLAARAGDGVTPRELGERCRFWMANREIRRTLGRLQATGVSAQYSSADVRDERAVRTAVADVRSRLGPVRALVHGAGVLADRPIDGKTLAEFDSVYSTKVAGLRSLLASVDLEDLELLVLFSSLSGRFGRAGQVEYATANEVLNKTAQQLAGQLRRCRVIAFNWGPWNGGMVTSSLKGVFQAEGVDLISPSDGAAFFLREVCSSAQDVEIVPLAGETLPHRTTTAPTPAAADVLSLAFERELTVERFPVLRSHVLAHRAVVPTALVLEWLAHAAMHNNPGLAFHGFDELRVLKGIRLTEKGTHLIRALAGKSTKHQSHYGVPVELHGVGPDGKNVLHVRVTIVLTRRLPEPPALPDVRFDPSPRDTTAIYRDLLFHGPDLQGLVALGNLSAERASAAVQAAPSPAAWIQQPLRNAWLADPLALDCAFQLMTIWSHELCGAFSLPSFAGCYRQFRHPFPRDVRVIAEVREQHAHRAIADLWFVDAEDQAIGFMKGYECVIDPSLDQAFRENQLRAEATPSA
jgi:acyl transferase domain-containing protein